MANQKKRGMSPVLAFVLGFLIALIVLVGAIAGAVYFALNYKLDKLSFNKDENGNYLYINADPDNGGVANVLELVKKVKGLAQDTSSLTLGEFENIFPVATKLTDGMHDALVKYVDLDMEEMRAVKFSALGNYLQDKVLEIRPADLIEGDSEVTDKVLGDLTLGDLMNGTDLTDRIYGLEITTFIDIVPTNNVMVYVGFGIKGLYYDGNNYTGSFMLDDGTVVKSYLEIDEKGYAESAYYYGEEQEQIEIPITTVELMNSRLANITKELALADVIDIMQPTENDKNSIMIYLAYSVSDVALTGERNVFTGYYRPDEQTCLLCTLIGNGNKIIQVYCETEEGVTVPDFTCVDDVGGQVTKLTQTLKLKEVITIDQTDRVMVKLGEYVIDRVGDAIETLTLDDFIDVTLSYSGGVPSPDTSEVILTYMVYGLTDIEEVGGQLVAVYHVNDGEDKQTFPAYLSVEQKDGKTVVTEAWYYIDGERVQITGTPVNGISDRVGGVTSDIKIGQLMDVSENRILETLKNSTVESLPDDIEELSINEIYADEIYGGDDNIAVMLLATRNVTDPDTQIEFDEKYIYYIATDEGYELYNRGGSEAGKLTAAQFKEGTYYTYGVPHPTWKLFLYDTELDDEGNVISSTERAYSVNNIDTFVNNITVNIRVSKMIELVEAGIVSMTVSQLSQPVLYKGELRQTADLTLSELLNCFSGLAVAP